MNYNSFMIIIENIYLSFWNAIRELKWVAL